MKKIYLLSVIFCLAALISKASPGDTTWIQAQNQQIPNNGNYDTVLNFPDGSVTYRKIYLYLTMGEYTCPAGSTYCHQWDYLMYNYLLTPGGDTLELNRLITPFATSGTPRFPSDWQQPYIFDITDFYPLLKNSATYRLWYAGGEPSGLTVNIKFAFIEGTPDRNVTGIKKIYDSRNGLTYGSATNPINNYLPAVSDVAPAGTQSATMRFIVTGHGYDANQCCEFASHYYDLFLNGTQLAQRDIWRTDCGVNELYAQGGTWVYNRGGWCPGAIVLPIYHDLPGVMAGTAYSMQIQFENYTVSSPSGQYIPGATIFYHGGFNKTIDASIDDIIAPTSSVDHFRENPSGAMPILHIHNSGGSTINSVSFSYGVKDSAAATYTWNGTLAPLQDTIITLPAMPSMQNMSISAASGQYQFVAQITGVNGAADDDPTNDTMRSYFIVAPEWPSNFIITMKTNDEGVNGLNVSPSETSWQITDMSGNVVASRANANVSTQYKDTVSLLNEGFYNLTITDGGCDGLHWWVWDDNPSYGVTAGSFVVQKDAIPAAQIPMNGYYYSGEFNNDFGCSFTQYFSTKGSTLGVNNITSVNGNTQLAVYPNPATEQITVSIGGPTSIDGTLQIIDAVGRQVWAQKTTQVKQTINTSMLSTGLYTVIFNDGHSGNTKLQARFIVTR